jgi:hypothetical protein
MLLQEPAAWEAQEDCRLLTPALADKSGEGSQRGRGGNRGAK